MENSKVGLLSVFRINRHSSNEAAISFSITAYAQQDQIDDFDNQLDNVITVRQTEPLSQALETGTITKAELEKITGTVITGFAGKALAFRKEAKQKLQEICENHTGTFEATGKDSPAQDLTQ